LDRPLRVDDDDRIGDGVEDRAQPQLTLTQRQLGGLAVGDVADDTDKDRITGITRLADRKIHRKHRPVFSPADDLPADPDDLFLAGAQIICEISIVLAGIGLRHQDLDVSSDEFGRGIAEEPLGRVVDRADCPVPVDNNDSIDRGVDDRTIQGIGEAPAILALQARFCRTQLPDP
jgi:hypothetical protein